MVTQPLVENLIELEFSVPCGNRRDCGHASWAFWAAHSSGQCPIEGFMCTPCKDAVAGIWADDLSTGDCLCNRCGNVVAGQVSDHLRFIKL